MKEDILPPKLAGFDAWECTSVQSGKKICHSLTSCIIYITVTGNVPAQYLKVILSNPISKRIDIDTK